MELSLELGRVSGGQGVFRTPRCGGFGTLFECVRKTFSGAPATFVFSQKWNNLLANYASLNVKRPEVGQSRPNSGRFSLFEHVF